MRTIASIPIGKSDEAGALFVDVLADPLALDIRRDGGGLVHIEARELRRLGDVLIVAYGMLVKAIGVNRMYHFFDALIIEAADKAVILEVRNLADTLLMAVEDLLESDDVADEDATMGDLPEEPADWVDRLHSLGL